MTDGLYIGSEVDGGGEVSWLTMCQLLLNANLPNSSESKKSPESPIPTDLVALVADLIPKPLSHHVPDWTDPEEQEWFRAFPGTGVRRDEAFDVWRREKAARAILAALKVEPAGEDTPEETDPHVLHAQCRHPGWEYATTTGQRKAWDDQDTPPDGEGWERNTDVNGEGWERFDYHEESYWRRPKL